MVDLSTFPPVRAHLSSQTEEVGTKVNCHGGQREADVLQGLDQFLEDDEVFYFEENISAVYLQETTSL